MFYCFVVMGFFFRYGINRDITEITKDPVTR